MKRFLGVLVALLLMCAPALAQTVVGGGGQATTSSLGVVKPDGTSIHIGADGTISAPTGGSGNVTGPGTSVVNHIATYSNTAGTGLQDTGNILGGASATGLQSLGLQSAAGNQRFFQIYTGTQFRWKFGSSSTAETTSVPLTTNAAASGTTLTFASTTGVTTSFLAYCSAGGGPTNATISSVTSTTIVISTAPTGNCAASGAAWTFYGNGGSNFVIQSFDNSPGHANIAVPFQILRNSGIVDIPLLSPGGGSAIALTSTTFSPITENIPSITGSSGGSQVVYNQFYVNNDSSTTGGSIANRFQYTFGGSGYTQAATGLGIIFTQDAATEPASSTNYYTAFNVVASSNFNSGGTSSNALGALYAGNTLAWLKSGATYQRELVDHEFDSEVDSGATVAQRENLKLELAGTHAVQGSSIDAMMTMGRSRTATVGSLFGLQLGEINNLFPIDNTNGTIIGHQYGLVAVAGVNPQANLGVDFSQINFGSAAWKSPGTKIDALGDHIIGPGEISWTAGTGTALDSPGYTGGTVGGNISVSVGGTGFVQGEIVTTGNGDIYSANVTSGAITSLTVIVPASSIGSPPSNPLTIQGDGGGFAQVSLTWTRSGTLSLNPSGGVIKIGSGAFTFTTLPSGTAATYACFTTGGQLISSTTAC